MKAFLLIFSFILTSHLTSFAGECPSRLAPGQQLKVGERLCSAENSVTAILQTDGNFVVYSRETRPLWSTQTSNGNHLIMQDDCNLVLYGTDGKAVWNSGTAGGTPPCRAQLHDDGSLRVYQTTIAWSSMKRESPVAGSNVPVCRVYDKASKGVQFGSVYWLYADDVFVTGTNHLSSLIDELRTRYVPKTCRVTDQTKEDILKLARAHQCFDSVQARLNAAFP